MNKKHLHTPWSHLCPWFWLSSRRTSPPAKHSQSSCWCWSLLALPARIGGHDSRSQLADARPCHFHDHGIVELADKTRSYCFYTGQTAIWLKFCFQEKKECLSKKTFPEGCQFMHHFTLNKSTNQACRIGSLRRWQNTKKNRISYTKIQWRTVSKPLLRIAWCRCFANSVKIMCTGNVQRLLVI